MEGIAREVQLFEGWRPFPLFGDALPAASDPVTFLPPAPLPEGFRTVRLAEDSIDEILALQSLVMQRSSRSWMFQPDPEEFIRATLKGAGFGIGVRQGESLMAYGLMSFPGDSDQNLGRDVGVNWGELDRVANVETHVVDPRSQARGLQLVLARESIVGAIARGYRHVCCTISPHNYPSLKNVMRYGLAIKALRLKYGGKDRYVLHLDTLRPPVREEEATESRRVRVGELEKHSRLFEQGFAGIAIRRKDLVFVRLETRQ